MWSRRLIEADAVSLGESPLWPTAAIVGAAALYADLPTRFIAGHAAGAFGVSRWLIPVLTVLVLAALLASAPGNPLMRNLGWREHRLHVTRRWLSLALIAVVSAANAASIVLLVHLLVNGAHANAPVLLRAAVHMWVVNVLLFALWYWQLDGGGPSARPTCAPTARDFLFPQQAEPALLEAGVEADVPRLSLRVVHERDGVQPDGCDAAEPLGEDADARAVGDQPDARGDGGRARREHPPVVATSRMEAHGRRDGVVRNGVARRRTSGGPAEISNRSTPRPGISAPRRSPCGMTAPITRDDRVASKGAIHMKGLLLTTGAIAAALTLTVGLGSALAASHATGGAAKVATANSSLGRILVDGRGHTLYLFAKDKHGRSSCAGQCAGFWPPLITSGKPRAGAGTKASLLGTTRRADGRLQVTYNHHPLYTFVKDTAKGQTNGEGVNTFGAEWDALSPAGAQVEMTSDTGNPAPGGYGGYGY